MTFPVRRVVHVTRAALAFGTPVAAQRWRCKVWNR